jgi:hypothetical protein
MCGCCLLDARCRARGVGGCRRCEYSFFLLFLLDRIVGLRVVALVSCSMADLVSPAS